MDLLHKAQNDPRLPKKIFESYACFYEFYKRNLALHNLSFATQEQYFALLLDMLLAQVENPYPFAPYHERILTPFDYYTFGVEFIRILVDKEKSRLYGEENVAKIQKQLAAQENAVLFANHQTEVDPQLMSLILEEKYRTLGEEMIFVAGDRVLSDPLAAPFSMGRNLLCIYSKRHIDVPPEKKHEKQEHNRKTMHRLKDLLTKGGKCIYVAPSGGRDRKESDGSIPVAPFDPQSIEMFRLMAKEAKTPTHFYPLALSTYSLLPPPPAIEQELGEMRRPAKGPIYFYFGNEIDMENYPGHEISDRHERRRVCAQYIWSLVHQGYLKFPSPKS